MILCLKETKSLSNIKLSYLLFNQSNAPYLYIFTSLSLTNVKHENRYIIFMF